MTGAGEEEGALAAAESEDLPWSKGQSSRTHVRGRAACRHLPTRLWTAAFLAQKPEWTPGPDPASSGPRPPTWETERRTRGRHGPCSDSPSRSLSPLSPRHCPQTDTRPRKITGRELHIFPAHQGGPGGFRPSPPSPTAAPSCGWPRGAVSPQHDGGSQAARSSLPLIPSVTRELRPLLPSWLLPGPCPQVVEGGVLTGDEPATATLAPQGAGPAGPGPALQPWHL